MSSSQPDPDEFQIFVTSRKGITSKISIQPSQTIADLKQQIHHELSYNAPRLLLHDKPLNDAFLVSESDIVPGSRLRAAKSKHYRKNRGPGPNERQRAKAAEACWQVDQLVALMTREDKIALRKRLNDEDEMSVDDDDDDDDGGGGGGGEIGKLVGDDEMEVDYQIEKHVKRVNDDGHKFDESKTL